MNLQNKFINIVWNIQKMKDCENILITLDNIIFLYSN